MNIPIEAIGSLLRGGAERIGETLAESETVRRLAKEGAKLGERIAEHDAVRYLAEEGAKLGERIAEHEAIRCLSEEGAKLGERIAEHDVVRRVTTKGTNLKKTYRRKKTNAALAIGFVGGVAVTLLAVRVVNRIKRKKQLERRRLELVREEERDHADI